MTDGQSNRRIHGISAQKTAEPTSSPRADERGGLEYVEDEGKSPLRWTGCSGSVALGAGSDGVTDVWRSGFSECGEDCACSGGCEFRRFVWGLGGLMGEAGEDVAYQDGVDVGS